MSSRQLFFLAIIAMPAYKLAMLPSYMASLSGRDMWLVALCMMLLDIGVLCMIYIVKSRVGKLNFENKVLKIVSKVIAMLFCVYFLLQVSLLSVETIEYTHQSFFDGVDRFQMILPLILVAVYLAYKGEKTLGRCSDIFIWGVALTVGISIVFNSASLDINLLFPVLDENGGEKLLSGYNVFLWFGDYLPLLFIDIKDRKTKSSSPVVFGALGLALSISLVFAVFTMQWGESTKEVPNAFARLAGYNFISPDVGKADWIAILNWIGSCAIKLGLLFLGAVNAFSYVFGKNTRKIFSISIFILVSAVVHFFIKDIKVEYDVGTGVRFIGFIMNLVVPFILCAMASLSKKTVVEIVDKSPTLYVTDDDYMDEKGANVCANC